MFLLIIIILLNGEYYLSYHFSGVYCSLIIHCKQMKNMKKIAILITVHNRKEKTLACLKNLYAQQLPNAVEIEVYLTDDSCTDGTVEAIRIHYPQTNIIKGDGNLFWK